MPSRESDAALRTELSPLLAGRDPHGWIEEAASALLDADGQKWPPVLLRQSLLQRLHIRSFSFEEGLAEPGRLRVTNDGFMIEVRSSLSQTPARWRLVVAHEMSHALLYDSTAWPPRRVTLSPLGSRAIEDLCWYGARCLLMPASFPRFAAVSTKGYSEHFLGDIATMAEPFQVSQHAMATRLVCDLRLVPAVVLGFQARHIELRGESVTEDWRLRWHVRPEQTQGLYIPAGQRGGSLPKAHGDLASFLSTCVREAGPGGVGEDEVDPVLFKGRTTGSLYRFLSADMRAERISLHWHCWTPTRQQDGLWEDRPEGVAYLTLYVLL